MTKSSDWCEQLIGTRRSGIFDVVLQTNNIPSKHDHLLCSYMMNETEDG